jgi:hypothetical protein
MPYGTREPGAQRMPPWKDVVDANVSPSVRSVRAPLGRLYLPGTMMDGDWQAMVRQISPRAGILCYNR